MSHYNSPKRIESAKNQEIKEITALFKKSSKRSEERLFVAEGRRIVLDIVARRRDLVKKIFLSEAIVMEELGLPEDLPMYILPQELFGRVSDTKTPQGIMAVVEMPDTEGKAIYEIPGKSPLLLVLEDIRDPGNLGTLFRTMEAGGGSGIILLGNCTDPFSPKCVRSSMGSVVHMPFVEYQDVDKLKDDLTKKGIPLFLADLDGADYRKEDFTGPCAILIGNEARGVSEDIKKVFENRISIPMEGGVESLNAAMSAGILLFEAKRQRDLKG